MHCEYETIHDDELTQVYFSSVENSDILIVNTQNIHYTHALGDCHYYLLQIPSIHLERISTDKNRTC